MNKVTIIAGDFNSCFVDQRDNSITKFLEDIGFSQHVSEATHLMGGHIDHVYSNHDRNVYDVTVLMYLRFLYLLPDNYWDNNCR